ncbi:MAG: tRNA 2-thiouridine(34) synthase MnmA [Planctomycetes bacterium]|nr:tRNA 2-thiouridine(34) synthase MnmA [Planctomycetota bacterium]
MSSAPNLPNAAGRVLVAMSGGVDSSVVASLLKARGASCFGVFMRNGVAGKGAAVEKSCCSASDSRDAARVAAKLDIPFYSVDYAAEFRRIIDYFVAEYENGRTPNPCVLCNQDLKFGHLFSIADDVGAEGVATGHYARVEDGKLLRAVDRQKDQSYYLFGIDRNSLPRVRFPLGGMTKAEVREHARRAGLVTADKAESMEICFVTSGDYRDVVREYGGGGKPGVFVDTSGRTVGEHAGVDGYTVGQRRGLPALGSPRFVKSIDAKNGTIVLGERHEVVQEQAAVRSVDWLVDVGWSAGIDCSIKVRARSDAVLGRVVPHPEREDVVAVEFEEPAFAITPGQAAVFYDGDVVLGGGFFD